MSYTANKKDPTRRAKILARREGRKGIDLDTLKLDKYHNYILPNTGIARGKPDGTRMKQSNRNAMMRRLGLRVGAKDITLKEAQAMIPAIMAGIMCKSGVYKNTTCKDLTNRAKLIAEANAE